MKVKSKLSFFDKIIFWLNALLCLALLISYLAPIVDPKKAWVFAFFGLAYPLLLIGSIAFMLYWMLRRKWHFLLSLVCIIVGWNVLRNSFALHMQSSGSYGPNAMVTHMMTYNVHNFKRYGSNNDISTKQEILQLIAEHRPDIIGFQEFYTRKTGQYDMRDSILKIMGTNWYYFEPVIANTQEAIGPAIFSRFPIVAHGIVPFSNKLGENSCLYIDIKKGDKQFRVYSVHLQSIRFDPDDYKYLNSISKQGKGDGSSVKRVGSKLKTAFIKRSDQVVKIKEHAAQCPYPYIISGDFNDTPSSYAVNQMSKGLKNAFREDGTGFGRTYNGDFPNYQIDYIMASPQFEIQNYLIIQKKLSDHYPVMSDLILK
ncbi:endonuclease/exonuclease/phosphatase family protein [Mucilaginibacter sp. BJC16-A38]|uniref:endonuclease/exonuclease/phosphatase family protein n=1 Tax=Mucilaginibacter phenanthrenivorans TaxID=1234842 RepID=UPI0021583116|nr:endonuclease/exonuclease/phosphatase family protein [Mucilaginibacter phenanthrenivorans]MCR8559132.1 endonuclease/exonuclease/phosphatase family protein [Mucilaginibacter phenanthrenivorans]